jgi:NADH-quinone oxidoreductase subunit J
LNDLFVPLAIAAAVALAAGLGVVVARRPVHAVVALLAHSLAIAALYLILAADLVALGQVLIYSGAIVVLFLFVVALLPSGGAEDPFGARRVISAAVAAGALLVALAAGLAVGGPAVAAVPAAQPTAVGGVEAIGRSLFGPLIVPFELTAPLLLVAIIGAVAIWRRQEPVRTEAGPMRPDVGSVSRERTP